LSGGKLGVIIPKNTPIPCDGEKDFVNDASDKEIIGISVFQGDNPDGGDGDIQTKNCQKIADMFLTGFGKYKAG